MGVHDQIVEVSVDHDNDNKNGAIPGTVGVHDQVTELDYRMSKPNEASYDNNNQNGAIPGTIGVFEQIAEVDHYDNNNKMGAIPGTIGVYEQLSEVGHLKGKRMSTSWGLTICISKALKLSYSHLNRYFSSEPMLFE